MNAEKAEVGKRYLSKTGVPVTVMGAKGDKVILRVEVSGNKVDVAKSYELRPYQESKINKESRLLMNSNGKKGKHREGSLAAIIDSLFDGSKTIQEIADIVAKKAGQAAKGKDLAANVRARMVSFRRQGLRVEKDEQKRVKVIGKKA